MFNFEFPKYWALNFENWTLNISSLIQGILFQSSKLQATFSTISLSVGETMEVMKNIAVLLLLVAGICCRKGENISTRSGDIAGSWELRRSEGGFAGTIFYSPGNGIILRFDKNSLYSFSRNSSVYETGSYQLKQTSSSGIFTLALTNSSNSVTTSISIQLDASTLIFLPASSCCDIATYIYNRIWHVGNKIKKWKLWR